MEAPIISICLDTKEKARPCITIRREKIKCHRKWMLLRVSSWKRSFNHVTCGKLFISGGLVAPVIYIEPLLVSGDTSPVDRFADRGIVGRVTFAEICLVTPGSCNELLLLCGDIFPVTALTYVGLVAPLVTLAKKWSCLPWSFKDVLLALGDIVARFVEIGLVAVLLTCNIVGLPAVGLVAQETFKDKLNLVSKYATSIRVPFRNMYVLLLLPFMVVFHERTWNFYYLRILLRTLDVSRV